MQERGAVERIELADDPRVAAYRDLKGRSTRAEGVFITEGRLLTGRLLASDFAVESVWVAERFAREYEALAAGRAPLYVSSEAVMEQVVGYAFHRGALACGRRREAMTVDALLGGVGVGEGATWIVCPDAAQAENLGSIFRTAAALGVDGILLGESCCDAFSRRCLRVSMGAVFRLPTVESTDLIADLRRLRQEGGAETVAAVLDETAELLSDFQRPKRMALLFGNEAEGLSERWLAECDRRITLPMQAGTDSLNLAVAAGVIVYEVMRRDETAR
jgi:tRNA G18 (ribose-2'-O)-methylase SpoU